MLVEAEHEGRVGLGEAAPIQRYGRGHGVRGAGRWTRWRRAWATRGAFAVAAARAAVPGQAVGGGRPRHGPPRPGGQAAAARRCTRSSASIPAATPQTSFTIGLDTPEVVVRKVREAADYPILKVKMGSDDDREVLRGGARHHRPPASAWTPTRAGRPPRRWSGWSGCTPWASSWWSSRCPRP